MSSKKRSRINDAVINIWNEDDSVTEARSKLWVCVMCKNPYFPNDAYLFCTRCDKRMCLLCAQIVSEEELAELECRSCLEQTCSYQLEEYRYSILHNGYPCSCTTCKVHDPKTGYFALQKMAKKWKRPRDVRQVQRKLNKLDKVEQKHVLVSVDFALDLNSAKRVKLTTPPDSEDDE